MSSAQEREAELAETRDGPAPAVSPRKAVSASGETPALTSPLPDSLVERVSAPIRPPEEPQHRLSAVELADLLLYALIRRNASGLRIEPDGYSHQITLELGEKNDAIAMLPADLGDAIVARFAIMAGLDVATAEQRMARVRIRCSSPEVSGDVELTELLVIIEPTRRGLEAELKRLAGRKDSAAQPTGDLVIGEPGAILPNSAGRASAYKILGEIGRGATGIVYRAEHTALGKTVAIKVLDARIATIPEQAARFAREGRAASRARHPGIIDVTDFGTLRDGRAFLVMELVEGRTLQSIVDDEGALDPPRAIAIGVQLASALDAAHKAGIIHRDIKPANIFVANKDQVKLGDFGAAKILESVPRPGDTQQKRLVGTPYYMAPEHALGETTDRRSDLYSLGCVVFVMLSGHVPFEGTKVPDVLAQHITSPIPDIESPFGPLPIIVRSIVMRSLAKKPDERYQTAAELQADLERAAIALSRSDWRRWLPL